MPGPLEERALFWAKPHWSTSTHQRNPGSWASWIALSHHTSLPWATAGGKLPRMSRLVGLWGLSSQEGVYSFSTLQNPHVCMTSYTTIPHPLAKIPKISVHLSLITSLTLKNIIPYTKIFTLTMLDMNRHQTFFSTLSMRLFWKRKSNQCSKGNRGTKLYARERPRVVPCVCRQEQLRGGRLILSISHMSLLIHILEFRVLWWCFREIVSEHFGRQFLESLAYKGVLNWHATSNGPINDFTNVQSVSEMVDMFMHAQTCSLVWEL